MKNSKSIYIFIIFATLIIIGIILYFYFTNISNNNLNSDISGTRTSYDLNNSQNTENNKAMQNTQQENIVPKETQISTFSTEILDNSEGRLTNIRITCDILNNTIIEPGQTFSFNEIVGQPSSARGYQEASIIINGEHETGIGGGNCQVSSTLYNAILEAENLSIIERNEHGGSGVAYVEKGKDAAVSYGSLDLKFRNDNNYKIKILMSSDDINITASIYKIEY